MASRTVLIVGGSHSQRAAYAGAASPRAARERLLLQRPPAAVCVAFTSKMDIRSFLWCLLASNPSQACLGRSWSSPLETRTVRRHRQSCRYASSRHYRRQNFQFLNVVSSANGAVLDIVRVMPGAIAIGILCLQHELSPVCVRLTTARAGTLSLEQLTCRGVVRLSVGPVSAAGGALTSKRSVLGFGTFATAPLDELGLPCLDIEQYPLLFLFNHFRHRSSDFPRLRAHACSRCIVSEASGTFTLRLTRHCRA
jgi:hypothetical protein